MPSLELVNLASLKRHAETRPKGYLEDCLSRGQIEGEFLRISAQELGALKLKYSPRGLGDKVARAAKPIARAIDTVFGTDLEHCQGCTDRQNWLNDHFPTS